MQEDARPIENDSFFPGSAPLEWPPRHGRGATYSNAVFYGEDRPRVAEEPFTVRFAKNPLAFAGILFLLGWIGIFAQRGFLRQLVVGAPVFEEFAKLGLALAFVTLLRVRSVWLRVPFGWASGAAFGIMEHFLSYSDEPMLLIVDRVAFHAAACGLSMAVYSLVEPLADARSRWMSTVASTLLHWANNFGAVLLGLVGLVFGAADIIDMGWSLVITASAFVLTLLVAVGRNRFRPRVARELERVFPPLHGEAAPTGAVAAGPEAPGPHSTSPETGPTPQPPEVGAAEAPPEPERPREPEAP